MARRKTKYRKKRPARPKEDEYPGWVWMIFGLAIGLSVAFAIYMKDREPSIAMRPATPQPASMAATMDQAQDGNRQGAEEGLTRAGPWGPGAALMFALTRPKFGQDITWEQ